MPLMNHRTDTVQMPRPAFWLAALLLGAAGFTSAQTSRRPAPTPKPVCLVADFRALALQTHDPRERAKATSDWLRTNGSACTAAQLGTLASNRAAWLGNADSPGLMGMIDGMLETLEAKAVKAPASAALPAPVTAPLPAAGASASASAAGATPAAAAANAVTTAGAPPPRTTPAANTANPVIAPVVVPVVVPGAPAARS